LERSLVVSNQLREFITKVIGLVKEAAPWSMSAFDSAREKLYMKYPDAKRSVITGIQRVSKPGRRVYVKSEKIPKVLNGYGISILSTSKGIMTDTEARELSLGGELLCNVW